MQISNPYTEETTLSLTVDDTRLAGICEPGTSDQRPTALDAVTADGTLETFLLGAQNLLIIINDATRPTPTAHMLDALLPVIERSGLADEAITLLVATGAHRAVKETELPQLLGDYAQRFAGRLVSHDARDDSTLVSVGTTRNGTPIILNRLLFAADRIIVTGSVEPHYFAGFTGGRKAFLPGIAGYQTIVDNHKLALSEQATSLALDGNPVHEDMMDALSHIDAPVFAVMTVLDTHQQIVSAAAGDIVSSFEKAVTIARKIYSVPIVAQADVVVSVAKFPMDINLYQSQKAIDNAALAVADGGTLILVSSCREGIGDDAFAKLLGTCATPEEALKRISGTYRLGYHKAAKMALVAQRITVMAHTQLEDDVVRSLFMHPVHDLQESVQAALLQAEHRGVQNPQVLILPDGCVTVPHTYEEDCP